MLHPTPSVEALRLEAGISAPGWVCGFLRRGRPTMHAHLSVPPLRPVRPSTASLPGHGVARAKPRQRPGLRGFLGSSPTCGSLLTRPVRSGPNDPEARRTILSYHHNKLHFILCRLAFFLQDFVSHCKNRQPASIMQLCYHALMRLPVHERTLTSGQI
jgi:hypothetical protein